MKIFFAGDGIIKGKGLLEGDFIHKIFFYWMNTSEFLRFPRISTVILHFETFFYIT